MPIRILIADDNASVRAAMRDVLEASGEWEIIEAENGEQAVTKAREFTPNLIILDLVMPAKDGLAASREIADMLPGTPILMHTLYSSAQIQIEAAKTGVRKVVAKSEATALVAAVQEALGKNEALASAETAGNNPSISSEDKRRTEDQIRELCLQIIATQDDALLQAKLAELREALHQHVEQFRNRLADFPLLPERRLRNEVWQSGADMPLGAVSAPDTSCEALPGPSQPEANADTNSKAKLPE